MSNMWSTSGAQDSSNQFLGQEHSSNLDQRQTVSLRDVNNEDSTTYPTHHQPLLRRPNWNPKTNKPSTGWTGKPKGRPPGARNKPKGPEHDLPKGPKKRGRPLGAKNKYPRGTWEPYPSTAERKGNPNESESSQTPTSNMAGTALVMAPATPTEDHTTYPNPPHGYAQVTSFSASLDSTTPMATPSSSTLTWDDFLPPMATPSFDTSPYLDNFTTPMATPYFTSTTSPYADQGGDGYQYPPPSDFDQVFGNGHFTFDNNGGSSSGNDPFAQSNLTYDSNGSSSSTGNDPFASFTLPYDNNGGGSGSGSSSSNDPFALSTPTYNNNGSSNDPFAPSTPYQEGTPAFEAPTPFLPASPTPQTYDASTSLTDAEPDDGLSKLRPRSSIAPNLATEPQDQSPAPATQGLFDNDDLYSLDLGNDNFFVAMAAEMGIHPSGELNDFGGV